MIRVIWWAFLLGLLTATLTAKESVEVFDFLIYGGLILMVIRHTRLYIKAHNMTLTLKDLW